MHIFVLLVARNPWKKASISNWITENTKRWGWGQPPIQGVCIRKRLISWIIEAIIVVKPTPGRLNPHIILWYKTTTSQIATKAWKLTNRLRKRESSLPSSRRSVAWVDIRYFFSSHYPLYLSYVVASFSSHHSFFMKTNTTVISFKLQQTLISNALTSSVNNIL